jgi:Sporulation protein YpjB (SpoYpjB)
MTLTKSVLGALVAIGLAGPALAQDDAKKTAEKIDQLSRDLQAIKESLKIDALRESAKTIDSKIDLLDKDIQDIKKDLKEIRRHMGEGSSTSMRPGFDSATANQARVRIINTHPFEMSVALNGSSYRLAPGEEKLFRVTPGEYRFEVLQIPGLVKSGAIAAGETKTFTIYPIQ